MLSVVFQDFALFSMPLKENVSGSQHPDTDRVKLCLEKGQEHRFFSSADGRLAL